MYSKIMQRYPQLATRFVLMPGGVGRELKNLRDAIDAAAFESENGLLEKLFNYDQAAVTAAGSTGEKVFFKGGWPAGYEKASKSWLYDVGQTVTVTAIKPGELGELIHITWASGGAFAVAVDGLEVTLTIKNDGTTKPSDLQGAIAADARLKGMIGITSTADAAIPNAFVTGGAATTEYLDGGTGLGVGFDIQNNQVWGNAAAIAFSANLPGKAAARYEVAWVDTAGVGANPVVTATRKRSTIAYEDGVTKVIEAVAAVNANRIAAEHLTAHAAGAGSAVLAGLDGKVYTLGLDFGTMVQVGDIMATITEVAADYMTIDYGALVVPGAGEVVNIRARLGLLDLGWISASTA